MKCSLIITTYNWVEALELCLKSSTMQSVAPNEIIIADDGSLDSTKEFIESFKKHTDIPIIHSWQQDDGFRLARSRNLAIAKSSYEYIIIVDGDMILHKNFVKDHLRCAKKGFYLQGSRVILDDTYSKKLLKDKKVKVDIFAKNVKNRLNGIYSTYISSFICSKNKATHKGVRGCNFSFFKDDCLSVNGFNEDFITWGREDSEFVERLYNKGIKRKNIKFSAIQYHIHHKEGNSNNQNDSILQKTIDKKLSWCENGVDKHLKGLDDKS